mgnify:CR=1 FL=1
MNAYLIQHKKERRDDFCMPAQWTGKLLGEMHVKGITCKQLLNGHREPKGAKERFHAALDELVAQKKEK